MRRNSVSGAPQMKKRGAPGKHSRALANEIMMTIPTLTLYPLSQEHHLQAAQEETNSRLQNRHRLALFAI
jgi:hypothetical protein